MSSTKDLGSISTAFHEITRCRSCDSQELIGVLDLGRQCVSDFVVDEREDVLSIPLELILCAPDLGGCGLLQLRHTTSPELLYRHYWYRSIVNTTMQIALRDITESIEARADLEKGDRVLDIGCNDGTLLRSYSNPGLELIGFEPARNIVNQAREGTSHIFNSFFNASEYLEAFGERSARAITSIAMFYDLEDPQTFVADVNRCLSDDGIWVIQMAYLPVMLEDTMFDNICHEHLEYYSLASLEDLLDRAGLEVIDVTQNDVNGGSYRTYIRRKGSSVPQSSYGAARVAAMRQFESHLQLQRRAPYEDFATRSLWICETIRSFIDNEVAAGRIVYGYGASTKGNTLLQLTGLDHHLVTAIAERNPDKWGRKTVGTGIPIISEEEARQDQPDYMLVLPWHFLREFREREADYLSKGGRFIVPLPTPRLVDRHGTTPLPQVAQTA